jgi:hypothetical protein
MFRFLKGHQSYLDLYDTLSSVPAKMPDNGFTIASPATGSNITYGTLEELIEEYRRYYRENKKHLHKWTKRKKPEWI